MCIEAAHQAARFALKSELKFVYKPRGKNLEGYISDYERCVGRTELVPRLRALNKQRIEVVHMLYVRSGLLTAIPERMKVAREAEEEALRLHDAVSDEYERLRTLANSHDPGSALVDLYVKQLMRENREKRELS